MEKFERVHTWGPSLKLESISRPGGTNRQVERIRGAVGVSIGTRTTFAKLFERDAPPDPQTDPLDALRARYLVAAIGLDAAEWGVDAVELPGAVDADRVLVLVGGNDAGGAKAGRDDKGLRPDQDGAASSSRMRGNRTLSNRTGSGRHRGAGRAPVQPIFPGDNPEHSGYPIAS